MQVNPKTDQRLHHKLPIDHDETILAVFRHHWFIYLKSSAMGIAIAVIIMAIAITLTSLGGNSDVTKYQNEILAGAAVFSILVLLGSYVPVYLRSQEQIVLTDESLLQVVQPSLFASRVDQLGLQRMDNVSVQQGFLGTILGFGHITIETPGEQDNYEFKILANPHEAAREISSQHEKYVAALEGGNRQEVEISAAAPQQVQINPEEYQQFLQYQQMLAKQKQEATGPAPEQQSTTETPPTSNPS